MNKKLNLLLLLVIVVCATVVFYTLKDEWFVKNYMSCVTSAKVVVYNDSGELTASHYISRCDDSNRLKNIIYIEEQDNHTRQPVYEGYSEQPANLYLFWDEYDGLYVAGTESDVITSAKTNDSNYRVEYLPLRELRVSLGEAYSKYKNSQLTN